MAYAGSLAIITGGLGGLGSTTARLLQSKGASLALLYAPFESRQKDSIIQDVFGDSHASRIDTYECDITSEAAVQETFHQIARHVPDETFPNILINSAGYVSVQPLEQTSGREAASNILTNLMGPFNTSKAFFRLYSQHAKEAASKSRPPPGGRIVNVASQAAHVALDGHGPYCASKAGLIALTKCMANEWAPQGITANTVSPGVILTAMGRKAWADEAVKARHLMEIPTRRFAEAEEVAAAMETL